MKKLELLIDEYADQQLKQAIRLNFLTYIETTPFHVMSNALKSNGYNDIGNNSTIASIKAYEGTTTMKNIISEGIFTHHQIDNRVKFHAKFFEALKKIILPDVVQTM